MPGGRQSAEEVARIGVAALARGKHTVLPYFGGKVITMLARVLPVGLITSQVEKRARPTPKKA
jgi:hypothetical protein